MAHWNIGLPPAEWFTAETPGLDGLVREIQDTRLVAIDTETTGLRKLEDIVLYWSLSWTTPGTERVRRCCLRSDVLPAFHRIFGQQERSWIYANAKFDEHMLCNTGFYLRGDMIDVAVMHALLYEEESHALKDMCDQILHWRWTDFATTFGKVDKKDPTDSYQRRLLRAEKEDLRKLVEYASNDAYGTYMLYLELRRQLLAAPTWSAYPEMLPNLWELYDKTEKPFTRVLWDCERAGMQVDEGHLNNIEAKVDQQIAANLRELTRLAGRLIKPKSGDQVAELLFGDLKLKPLKMTKGGASSAPKPSTDKETLQEMALQTQDPKALAVLRALIGFADVNALKTNFLPGIRKSLDRNGRVHTSFNQNRAVTGRLSSSDPNMQNLRHPDKDPFSLRKAIVAPPGCLLIAADYEALEMMVLAAAACEEEMLDIFRRGWDIHMGNASMVFGYPYEDIKEAKKVQGLVKDHKLPDDAYTDYFKKCMAARQAVKTIGYG